MSRFFNTLIIFILFKVMFTGVNVGAIFERTLAVAAAKVATTATGAKLIKAVKDLASGILNKSSLRAWLSQGRSAITLGYNCDYFFDKVRTVYITNNSLALYLTLFYFKVFSAFSVLLQEETKINCIYIGQFYITISSKLLFLEVQ